MASGESSGGSAIGAGVGIGLAFIGPILIVILLVLGSTASAQPNPNGATTPQKINPNPATSALAAELGDFSRYQNVNGYLTQNSPLLTDLQTRLSIISNQLVAGTPYKGISGDNVTKMIAAIQNMQTDLTTITGQVNAGAAASTIATQASADLQSNLKLLQGLSENGSAATFVQELEQIVNYNNDGKGPITFPASDDQAIVYGANGSSGIPATLDCAGFVSYALEKIGILAPGKNETTVGFATDMINDPRFTVVAENFSGGLSSATVTQDLQPGDIIISGTAGQSVQSGTEDNHAWVYLGTITTPRYGTVPTIAESTGSSEDESHTGRNGPRYDTLADRISNHGQIQLILRLTGVSPSS